MTRSIIAVALLSTMLLSASAESAVTRDDVVVTLRLEQESTLPGIPVPVTLIVENRSPNVLEIPTYLEFTVAGEFGELETGGSIPRDQMGKSFRLDPGVRKEIFFAVKTTLGVDGSTVFNRREVAFPGEYRIRVRMPAWTRDPVAKATNPDPVSNEVVLTVREPSGDDAEIWSRMLECTGGKGWGAADWWSPVLPCDDLGILELKESSYYPYSLLRQLLNPNAEEEALATGKLPELMVEEAFLQIGRGLLAEADKAYHLSKNIDLAVEFAARARVPLEKVARESRIPWNRERAEKELVKALTREQYEAMDAHLRATAHPTPERVTPFVECIALDGKRLTARFGYDNPNRGAKQIPVGKDNMITPAPQDRGQTRFFRPGRQAGAVSVNVEGNLIKWHLDGSEAAATPDFEVRCDQGGE